MASTNEQQLKPKKAAKRGDRGQALFIKRDSTWWHVTDEDADRETGYQEGHWGSYAPVNSILTNDFQNVFPDYDLEDGAIVRIYVEVIRP